MTYPYNSQNIPLTDLFDPDVMGDGPTAPNFKVAGIPLRFAHIKYGSKRADVGYTENNIDVSNKWSAKGTAVYSLPINGDTFHAASFGTVSSAMDARVVMSINANGSYSVVSTGNGIATPTASGTWLPSGQVASDYQVQFSVTQTSQRPTGPATITNGSPAYSACTSNRSVTIDAQVGQLTGLDRGGVYTVQISLKRVSTGVVTVTTIYADVQSAGSG